MTFLKISKKTKGRFLFFQESTSGKIVSYKPFLITHTACSESSAMIYLLKARLIIHASITLGDLADFMIALCSESVPSNLFQLLLQPFSALLQLIIPIWCSEEFDRRLNVNKAWRKLL